ncbi:hypothetical protein BP5796_08574 [Coleophoma crateriformis]|uniref:NAD(P)-binding protein n=1 Tax=Coleophoma crateriformis TaxID=565419 RepID=A0A3D8R808_9HELO|nr:hypothetical protein BP5796_08574 [Coleophoma crateriformis]
MAATNTGLLLANESSLTARRDTYPFIDPFRFKDQLYGKVVLITHAHRGIGRASCLAFAAAGATVVCVAQPNTSLVSLVDDIKDFWGTPTYPITADLLDPTVPQRIVALVEEEVGPIDILVNHTPPAYHRPFFREPKDLADWWGVIESCLRVPVAFTHAVLPSMIARSTGIIISTTVVVKPVNIPFMSASGVAKAALIKFHHQMHLENRAKGILSFAVHPGLVPSHMHDPDSPVRLSPEDFLAEPRMRTEVTERVGELEWAAAGLASGTFVALCADERCQVLSGLLINAERDLGEMVAIVEREKAWGGGGRVERERLYVLKVDEL